MADISYKPSESDINKVERKMTSKDKFDMEKILLKKFKFWGKGHRMAKKGIYYLLACMSKIGGTGGIDFKAVPSNGTKTDNKMSYLWLILKYINDYTKPLKTADDIVYCLTNAFDETISKKNNMLLAIQNPKFTHLINYIEPDADNSKNTTETRKRISLHPQKPHGGSEQTKFRTESNTDDSQNSIKRRRPFRKISLHRQNQHEELTKVLKSMIDENKDKLKNYYDTHKDDELAKYYYSEIFYDLKAILNGGERGAATLHFDEFSRYHLKNLKMDELKKCINLMTRAIEFVKEQEGVEGKQTRSKGGKILKNGLSDVVQTEVTSRKEEVKAEDKVGATLRKRGFSLNLGGKENAKKKITTPRMRRHSFSGSTKTESRKMLLSMIDSEKMILTAFYNDAKDERYPDFENNFNDLKKVLNGGIRGAEKLEFDKFVNKYIKKLDEKEIRNCINLMTKAMAYTEEVDSLKKSFESDGKILDKKFQKISELYSLQSDCKLFSELGKFCTGYKDVCLGYLSEGVKGEFNKKFDYRKLKDQFSPDILKVYGTKSDFYHGKLLSDYKDNKVYAKLTINQEYGQVNDKTFNTDISLLEKCREKTDTFLNDMYKYTRENCDEYTPVHIIPKADIEEANQMFSRIIESLKKMRNDWNKL